MEHGAAPDPQSYVKYGYNQPLLEVMTRWIRYNVERLNIRLVLCTGDMVEENFRTMSEAERLARRPAVDRAVGVRLALVRHARRHDSLHSVHRQPRLRLQKLREPVQPAELLFPAQPRQPVRRAADRHVRECGGRQDDRERVVRVQGADGRELSDRIARVSAAPRDRRGRPPNWSRVPSTAITGSSGSLTA